MKRPSYWETNVLSHLRTADRLLQDVNVKLSVSGSCNTLSPSALPVLTLDIWEQGVCGAIWPLSEQLWWSMLPRFYLVQTLRQHWCLSKHSALPVLHCIKTHHCLFLPVLTHQPCRKAQSPYIVFTVWITTSTPVQLVAANSGFLSDLISFANEQKQQMLKAVWV